MVFSFFKNVSFHLDYKAVEVLADAGEREYKEALIGILTTKINLYYDYSEKNMILLLLMCYNIFREKVMIMKKVIYILSGVIALLLVVIIIQGYKINKLSNGSTQKSDSNLEEAGKKYVGLYHTSNYRRGNLIEEETIRLNEDGSCKLLWDSNCTWKIKSEKVLLVTTFKFNGYDKDEDGNERVRSFGSQSMDACEEGMASVNADGKCRKDETIYELDVVSGGIMYDNYIFTKVN